MKNRAMATAILMTGAMALTGCGGGDSKAAKTVTQTVSATPTGGSSNSGAAAPTSDTSSPTQETSTDTPTSDTSTPSETSEPDAVESSSGTTVIHVQDQDKELAYEDAWKPQDGEWEEGNFAGGGSAASGTGIRSKEVYCDQELLNPLEYRFQQSNGVLHINIAQDGQSESSGETLQFTLLVDGTTKQTKKIDFKSHDTLTTPLAGVASVKVAVKDVTTGECTADSQANALITKVWITKN